MPNHKSIEERRRYSREYKRRRYHEDPDYRVKHHARTAVRKAVKRGLLIEQPCERCASTDAIEAHHEDYSKPLDVRWLCQSHHEERHREIDAQRGAPEAL